MKQVSGTLRLELAQYRELASFAQFGSDLDKDTRRRLEKGKRLVEILKQDQYEPLDVNYQIIMLYAGVNDFLSDIDVKKIREFEKGFFEYIKSSEILLLDSLKREKKITDEIKEDLEEAILTFKNMFLEE